MRSLIFLLLLSFNATAALYDRGNGLIYDDVLDITWLQDANYAKTSGHDADGAMTWFEANIWANNLVYQGFENWRLPSTIQPYLEFGPRQNHITELGFMIKSNLSNSGSDCAHVCLQNTSFLDNTTFNTISFEGLLLDTGGGTVPTPFWFQEEVSDDELSYIYLSEPAFSYYQGQIAWIYQVSANLFRHDSKTDPYRAWAVHDGDIGASEVPLPAGIYLFLSGLVGLGLMRGRNA